MRTPSSGVLILLAGAGLALCAATGWVTTTGTASGDVPLEVTARVLMIALPIAVGLAVHLQLVGGIVLALVDLLLRQLARAQRIAAGQLGRGGVVGDRLHLEDVQPAKFGDLLEGE